MERVKINEVEALVGITKKNIRFYEEQGLLTPKRNSENSYRDYGDGEVQTLMRIKLLRKLGVPIEEIRQMFCGTHTVGDGMRRHLITLEREHRNLEQCIALCSRMQTMEIPVTALDTGELLTRMEEMERSGTSFRNQQIADVRVQYGPPVVAAVVTVSFMLGIILMLCWAYIQNPAEAPPIWVLGIIAAACLAVCVGVLIALVQRLREIGKGEIDDAKRY